MIAIAAIGVIGAGIAVAVTFGRRRRQERQEVESMFSADGDDRVWWEERR